MWILLLPKEYYSSKKGTILINSFWILFILLLIVSAFAWRVSLELKISKIFTSRVKATSLLKAGLYWAMEVKNKFDNTPFDSLNDIWAGKEENEYFQNKEVEGEEFNIKYLDHYNEKGEPIYYYGLIDEERKVNLNWNIDINISIGEKSISITSFQILERLLSNLNLVELNPEIITAIIDWRDQDQDTPNHDNENDYYGYTNRNNNFKVLEELLLLKGMDKEKFEKLQRYLTVYGDGKININTASREVLLAVVNTILSFSGMTIEPNLLVDQIIQNRPFQSLERIDLSGIPREALEILKRFIFTVRSDTFQANIEAKTGNIRKTVKAIFELKGTKGKIIYWNEN